LPQNPGETGKQLSDVAAYIKKTGSDLKFCETCDEDDYEPSGIWLAHPTNAVTGNAFVGLCDCSACGTNYDNHPFYSCQICKPEYRMWWNIEVWAGVKTGISQCSGVWFKTSGRVRGDSVKLPGAKQVDRENDGGLISENNVVHSGGIGFRYYRPAWRPSKSLAEPIHEKNQVLYKLFQAVHLRKNRNFIFSGYRIMDNRVGISLDQDERATLKDSLVTCRSELSYNEACESNNKGIMLGGQLASVGHVGVAFGFNNYEENAPFVGTYWGLSNALKDVTFADCPSTCTEYNGTLGTLPVYAIYAPKDPRRSPAGEMLKHPYDALDGIRTLTTKGHPVDRLFHMRHPEMDPTIAVKSYGADHSVFRVVNSTEIFGGYDIPNDPERSGSWLIADDHPQLSFLRRAHMCESGATPGVKGATSCPAATQGTLWSPDPICFRGMYVGIKLANQVSEATLKGGIYAVLDWFGTGTEYPIKRVMSGSKDIYHWKGVYVGLRVQFNLIGGFGARGSYQLRFEDSTGAPLPVQEVNVTLFETKTGSERIGVKSDGDTESSMLTAHCPINLTIAKLDMYNGAGTFLGYGAVSAATFKSEDSPPLHSDDAGRCLPSQCSTLADGSHACPGWTAGMIKVGEDVLACTPYSPSAPSLPPVASPPFPPLHPPPPPSLPPPPAPPPPACLQDLWSTDPISTIGWTGCKPSSCKFQTTRLKCPHTCGGATVAAAYNTGCVNSDVGSAADGGNAAEWCAAERDKGNCATRGIGSVKCIYTCSQACDLPSAEKAYYCWPPP